MNGKTGGIRDPRRAGALAAAAAAAVLATACSAQTSTSYHAGPAGSATYRQDIAFVQCMRRHGVRNLPDPPPGGGITLQVPQNGAQGKPGDPWAQGVDACKHLLPRGREITNIQIGVA
jgi:hypothetical protein